MVTLGPEHTQCLASKGTQRTLGVPLPSFLSVCFGASRPRRTPRQTMVGGAEQNLRGHSFSGPP